jgi:hypothetical protein
VPPETNNTTVDSATWEYSVLSEIEQAVSALRLGHEFVSGQLLSVGWLRPHCRLVELTAIFDSVVQAAVSEVVAEYETAKTARFSELSADEACLRAAVFALERSAPMRQHATNGSGFWAHQKRVFTELMAGFITNGFAYYGGRPGEEDYFGDEAGYRHANEEAVHGLWWTAQYMVRREARVRIMRHVLADTDFLDSDLHADYTVFAPSDRRLPTVDLDNQIRAAMLLRGLIPGWVSDMDGGITSALYSWTDAVERAFVGVTTGIFVCSCDTVCGADDERATLHNGELICENCEQETETCGTCNDLFWRDDMSLDPGGEYICDGCRSEHLATCENCGEDYWWENGSCNHCGYGGEGNGEYGNLEVYSYSYKPEPRFHWVAEDGTIRSGWGPSETVSDGIFMGVELETNCSGYEPRRLGGNAIYDAAIMSEYNFIYAKSDCTVSGPEIVSHPATLDAHRVLWQTFPWRELRLDHGWSGWRGANAGCHIHIARTAFRSKSHMARFQMLFGGWRDELVKFCGRNCHNYGYHGDYMKRHAVDYARGVRVPPRGSAINYEPRQTIEVRMFRSSLQPTTLAAYLEFVHGLVVYAGQKRSSDILTGQVTPFGSFVKWMEENGNYTNAVARTAERIYS